MLLELVLGVVALLLGVVELRELLVLLLGVLELLGVELLDAPAPDSTISASGWAVVMLPRPIEVELELGCELELVLGCALELVLGCVLGVVLGVVCELELLLPDIELCCWSAWNNGTSRPSNCWP